MLDARLAPGLRYQLLRAQTPELVPINLCVKIATDDTVTAQPTAAATPMRLPDHHEANLPWPHKR
jgi:hypothetical protein